MCCHTEIEVAHQTFYLTQSQYTDTGPTSPSADPITPGAWQGSHWRADRDRGQWKRQTDIDRQTETEYREKDAKTEINRPADSKTESARKTRGRLKIVTRQSNCRLIFPSSFQTCKASNNRPQRRVTEKRHIFIEIIPVTWYHRVRTKHTPFSLPLSKSQSVHVLFTTVATRYYCVHLCELIILQVALSLYWKSHALIILSQSVVRTRIRTQQTKKQKNKKHDHHQPVLSIQ